MEKINIAEILKDCPKGMELNCVMNENVYFGKICDDEDCIYPIRCYMIEDGVRTLINFTKYGEFNTIGTAKCVIYPKGKTTWEGFVPPCKFKDGDVIFTHANCLKVGVGNTWISIFQEKRNGGVATYIDYAEDGSDYYSNLDGDKALLCMENDILRQRLATEEEKQKLFDAIEKNGYKWNAETKTLEKLIEPKFKVGDRIKNKNSGICDRVIKIFEDCYLVESCLDEQSTIGFDIQDNWELVINKFDINTLVPFESKVLIRNDKEQHWIPAFWGCKCNDDEYVTTYGWSLYCIPYEGNEHLLGTTDDCDEFYKTW